VRATIDRPYAPPYATKKPSARMTVTLSVDDAERVKRGIALLLQLVDDNIGAPDIGAASDFDKVSDLLYQLENPL